MEEEADSDPQFEPIKQFFMTTSPIIKESVILDPVPVTQEAETGQAGKWHPFVFLDNIFLLNLDLISTSTAKFWDNFTNVYIAAKISEVLARLEKWAKTNLQPSAPVKRIASNHLKQMTEQDILNADMYELIEKMVVMYNIATLKSKSIQQQQNEIVEKRDGKFFYKHFSLSFQLMSNVSNL